MSILSHAPARAPSRPTLAGLSPGTARGFLVLLMAAAIAVGFLATDAASVAKATSDAGGDLTRLLRLMTLIKALMAAAAASAVLWRLGSPVSVGRFGTYGLACCAMVVGPGLIWGMVHVGLGALLLHAGLAATVVLLWRDPVVAGRLEAILKRRAARR